jgi:hypothetical protein
MVRLRRPADKGQTEVARSQGGLNPAEPQSPHLTQVAYKFLDVEGRAPNTT